MIVKTTGLVLLLFFNTVGYGQEEKQNIKSFYLLDSIKVTMDLPDHFKKNRPAIVVFYALPNGNSTAQTMGKTIQPGDDWHFDIQHIAAQTRFIRQQLRNENFIVVYLENRYKSWPAWKQRNENFNKKIPRIIDTVLSLVKTKKGKSIYLNGHSGGGSFIFGYLASFPEIPSQVKRISFLDSDYGYDSSYYPKFRSWLNRVPNSALNVFAYNDSVVIYNGKPLVSPTGGTWYRSHLFLKHLYPDFAMVKLRDDSLIVYKSVNERIQFFFKTNPEGKIFHTQQVELNGFIHSILAGTGFDSKNYQYYGPRAYSALIK